MKTIVISLGGSLIVPDEIDSQFIREFKKTIESSVKKKYRFVIICGGGSTARKYQEAARTIANVNSEGQDWIGIYATAINALLVLNVFGDQAEDAILTDPSTPLKTKKNIIISCGWKPGWSTDYDAVLLAKNVKADLVINMSNIDYVYDSDPRKNKNAKKISRMSWNELQKMIGTRWKAGMNAPFDPIAAKEARKLGLKIHIIGKDLQNLRNLIEGRPFKGTMILN